MSTKCSRNSKTNFALYLTSDAANNLVRPHIVPFEDFYNKSLERCDLLSEYYKWQNVYSHGGYVYDEILLMCIESIFVFLSWDLSRGHVFFLNSRNIWYFLMIQALLKVFFFFSGSARVFLRIEF